MTIARDGGLQVVKGHGTENDFVLLPDPDGRLDVGPDLVRALCDRRAGVGADGVLRVVRSRHVDGAPGDAEWFMDYRNADGSLAEMCGNGVRVFTRYLAAIGAIGAEGTIGTRAGTVQVRLLDDEDVAVTLGPPRVLPDEHEVSVAGAPARPGVSVDMPNPHVVVAVDTDSEIDLLDLSTPPVVTPPRPEGQNVEFVARLGPRHVRMRVHERGVGETRSCGTGICAVVAALGAPDGTRWQVDVPGGTCTVTWQADGPIVLAGPAVLVAELRLTPEWLGRTQRFATAAR